MVILRISIVRAHSLFLALRVVSGRFFKQFNACKNDRHNDIYVYEPSEGS
jgi:hypothetical protein